MNVHELYDLPMIQMLLAMHDYYEKCTCLFYSNSLGGTCDMAENYNYCDMHCLNILYDSYISYFSARCFKSLLVLVFLYYYCSHCLYVPWKNCFRQLQDSPGNITLLGDFSHLIFLYFQIAPIVTTIEMEVALDFHYINN